MLSPLKHCFQCIRLYDVWHIVYCTGGFFCFHLKTGNAIDQNCSLHIVLKHGRQTKRKPNKPAFPLFQQRWRTNCLMWWFIFRDRILNLFFFNILKLPVNSQGFLTTHVKSAVIFGSISRKTKTEDLRELIKIHYFWKVKSSLVWKCFSLAWG